MPVNRCGGIYFDGMLSADISYTVQHYFDVQPAAFFQPIFTLLKLNHTFIC